MQLVTFLLNGNRFGIAVNDVESIETKMEIFGVPHAPANIRGIIKLHGSIVPIYNLASRFGYPEGEIQNIIVAGVDGIKIGLEVESVKEIIEVPDRAIEHMPELMNAAHNCFNDIASKDQELINILDVKRLIGSEEEQNIRNLIENQK